MIMCARFSSLALDELAVGPSLPCAVLGPSMSKLIHVFIGVRTYLTEKRIGALALMLWLSNNHRFVYTNKNH